MMRWFLVLILPIFVMGQSASTGYYVPAGTTKFIQLQDGTWTKIVNSGASNYFVPTKTTTEWNAFTTNKPAVLAVSTLNPTSCKEIKNGVPGSVDGNYDIDPEGDGTTMQVYCDMTTDGGGWTLIARTAVASAGQYVCADSAYTTQGACEAAGKFWTPDARLYNFGWKRSIGTLANDSLPYSIGVLSLPIVFSETLVGQRASGSNKSVNHQIKYNMSSTLANNNTTSSFTNVGTWINRPTWPYTSRPYMQGSTGFTDAVYTYYFRDCCGASDGGTYNYGVNWWGLNTGYCGNTGGMAEYSGPYCGGDTLGSTETRQVLLYIR